jgi:hypothetical protein
MKMRNFEANPTHLVKLNQTAGNVHATRLMQRRCGRLAIVVWTLAVFASLSQAENQGTACVLNPQADVDSVELRTKPEIAATLLQKVQPSENTLYFLDMVSRGFKNNDWLKVKSGTTIGWVKAENLLCRLNPDEARLEIAAETASVIRALKEKDAKTLAKFVHPIKSLRFTPNTTVEPKRDVELAGRQIPTLFGKVPLRVWGNFDGSGKPIRLSPFAYYRKFVYDRDFASAPSISFNTFQATATNEDNIWEIYPNALIVEYYVPPSEPAGNDWASRRLVYEKNEGKWYLRAIVHSHWTT